MFECTRVFRLFSLSWADWAWWGFSHNLWLFFSSFLFVFVLYLKLSKSQKTKDRWHYPCQWLLPMTLGPVGWKKSGLGNLSFLGTSERKQEIWWLDFMQQRKREESVVNLSYRIQPRVLWTVRGEGCIRATWLVWHCLSDKGSTVLTLVTSVLVFPLSWVHILCLPWWLIFRALLNSSLSTSFAHWKLFFQLEN